MTTLSNTLKILIVEDSEDDTVLLTTQLAQEGGFDIFFERIETADEMKAALKQRTWDIILADYTLPNFSGPKALEVLQASGLDIPFIIVSGTIGEETAVALLKAGAHDFILKNKPVRLITAIERELEEAHIRAEKKAAEKALHESEARFRQVVESNMIGIVFSDRLGSITDTNDAFLNMIGYTRQEVLSGSVRWMDLSREYLYPDEESLKQSRTRWVFRPFRYSFEHKDGSIIDAMIGGSRLENDSQHQYVCFVLNHTLCETVEKYESMGSAHIEALPS